MASTSAAEPSSAMNKYPNWVEMPEEVMVDIFNRLGTFEILNSALKVCTTWRRICKHPEMWKVIHILRWPGTDPLWCCKLEKMTKHAVVLSCGELIDISVMGFINDDLLDYILLSSSKLKRLCLFSCNNITSSRLSQAVKRVPQLEKLELYYIDIKGEDIEIIGRNCPQLKSFIMSIPNGGIFPKCNDRFLPLRITCLS